MGPYPVFACSDWAGLHADLSALEDELVSVGLVADPFGDWTLDLLDETFPDRRYAFKQHFVVALSPDPLATVSAHHRRFATRGLHKVAVERVRNPSSILDEWLRLYTVLTRRHAVTGIAAFSPRSFELQLMVPGVVAFRAMEGGATVGAALWYVDGEVAHWHLAAYSARGYEIHASYALMATALEQLAAWGLQWASLGAGAGVRAKRDDGLSQFKAGWASHTRTAHFCGRILDHARYSALSPAATSFFPAYRGGDR